MRVAVVARPWLIVAVTVVATLLLVALASSAIAGPRAALPSLPTAPTATLAATTASVASIAPTATPALRFGLPNPGRTPGSINPNVRQDNIGDTICVAGWTTTVRPPTAYTSALEFAQIIEYGYEDRDRSHYEEDHLVPLELGGAPRDPRNLWPQPMTATLADGTPIGADEKDDLEDELKRRVCAGTMLLADAQRAIAGDWTAAWEAAGRP